VPDSASAAASAPARDAPPAPKSPPAPEAPSAPDAPPAGEEAASEVYGVAVDEMVVPEVVVDPIVTFVLAAIASAIALSSAMAQLTRVFPCDRVQMVSATLAPVSAAFAYLSTERIAEILPARFEPFIMPFVGTLASFIFAAALLGVGDELRHRQLGVVGMVALAARALCAWEPRDAWPYAARVEPAPSPAPHVRGPASNFQAADRRATVARCSVLAALTVVVASLLGFI
jgi:hypothetical protein